MGVVVVGAVAAILYCCCFAAGRHSDDYSDEENQYSLDDGTLSPKHMSLAYVSKAPLQLLSTNLNRQSSSKSLRTIFGVDPPMGRSPSRKKLRQSSADLSPMFPILEFDLRLDPRTMFVEPKASLSDENDYLRRILHIANPE